MIRPLTNGPRSFTRSSSCRPFSRLVTRTRLGSGNVGCAAVTPFMSKRSPFAVGRPWNAGPYQEATPVLS